jgi:hypothetical protein
MRYLSMGAISECLVATAAVLVMASGKSVVVAKADLKTWSWKSSAGIPA